MMMIVMMIMMMIQAGVSRSPTIAIAYLIKYFSMATGDAYKFIKCRRSIISPNLNFMGQLLEFEKSVKEVKETSPIRGQYLGGVTDQSEGTETPIRGHSVITLDQSEAGKPFWDATELGSEKWPIRGPGHVITLDQSEASEKISWLQDAGVKSGEPGCGV